MFKKSAVVFIAVVSIFSVILFSEMSGAAKEDNSVNQKNTSEDVVKFSIQPAALTMYPGGSMQLIATAYDSTGKKIIVNPEWIIKSDVSAFGEFDKPEGQKVIFSALKSGNGSIVAVYNNIEVEVKVKIFQPGK